MSKSDQTGFPLRCLAQIPSPVLDAERPTNPFEWWLKNALKISYSIKCDSNLVATALDGDSFKWSDLFH